MEKELTDEEKKIAEELYKSIRDENKSPKHEERLENVIKKIVKLSEDGLKEDEILVQVRDDVVVFNEEGAAAIKRMLSIHPK